MPAVLLQGDPRRAAGRGGHRVLTQQQRRTLKGLHGQGQQPTANEAQQDKQRGPPAYGNGRPAHAAQAVEHGSQAGWSGTHALTSMPDFPLTCLSSYHAGVTSPRPASRPIPAQPAGYVQLARYSSLTHLWRVIAGAERMGREVTLVRGDTEETARRKISGYALANAGTFIDTTPILRDLEDGFDVHPALVALLAGDTEPLRSELDAHHELQLDFTIALAANRDFICRPDFRFVPIVKGLSDLPSHLKLRARRFSRDEINMLLLRACGMA